MTVSASVIKHVYDGNGVTTLWPFTFPIVLTTDIQVWFTAADGTITQITSNFEVDVVTDVLVPRVIYPTPASGLSPIATGTKLTIIRVEPLTQAVNLQEQGAFSANVIMGAFDKLTMITQELSERVNRSVKFPIDENPTADDTDTFLNTINVAKAAAQAASAAATVSQNLAAGYASAASGYATTANTQAGIATTQAGIATTQAGLAAASAVSAHNYSDLAAGSAAEITGVLTTKGDLLSRSATALAALAVGTNGQMLVADSTTATGLKWSNTVASLNSLAGITLAGTIVGVTTAITGTTNNKLTISVPNQTSANNGIGIEIKADNAFAPANGGATGGSITLTAGEGAASGLHGYIGGNININAGPGNSTWGQGGDVNIAAGGGGAIGSGGDINLTPGLVATTPGKINILGSWTAASQTCANLGTVTTATSITSALFKCPTGATIDEFSIDTTMGGNSDTALPTEKAVKTYVDTAIASAVKLTIAPATSTHNVAASDELIRCNGTFAVNLPAATGTGRLLYIKNIGTGTVTIQANGAETIDGTNTRTLSVQYSAFTICDGGSGTWDIIA